MLCGGTLQCINPSLDAQKALAKRVEDIVNSVVNPASIHVHVSELKICPSKCIPSNDKTANDSLNQLWFPGS